MRYSPDFNFRIMSNIYHHPNNVCAAIYFTGIVFAPVLLNDFLLNTDYLVPLWLVNDIFHFFGCLQKRIAGKSFVLFFLNAGS
jgi:hypothetical protein